MQYVQHQKEKRRLLWQVYAAKAFYFLGGFGFTVWASLIPFLKKSLGVPEDELGLLLLTLGFGALLMMFFAGSIAARLGCRRSLIIGGLGMVLCLNALCHMPVYGGAIAAAIVLGASLGLSDVVVNINGIYIERRVHRRLMSGLQAMWSLGNFVGAAFFALFLNLGLPWQAVTLVASLFITALIVFFSPHLMQEKQAAGGTSHFVRPKPLIVFIGIVCTISFLVEGSINDWSGVFLTTEKGVALAHSGLGLTLFTASAFLIRLPGDSLTMHFGSRRILLVSLPLAFIGFLGLLILNPGPLLLFSFVLIGIGCANTVPIFYSLLGTQKVMPVPDAVSTVSTIGYVGVLLAPAVLGFIGRAFSLYASFTLVTVLLVLMAGLALHLLRRVGAA